MKKTSLFAMALAVACLFAACTKEGVYNPGEKISKVSISSTDTYTYGGTTTTNTVDKYMSESWSWDGNLVKSITYYNSDQSIRHTATFTYDGKQLTSLQVGKSRTDFTYDGSKISKFESYYDGELESTATVTYDGKKVVQIDVVNVDKKAVKNDNSLFLPLQVVMPVYTEKTAEMVNTIATKGSNTNTMKFEWDGKNISKVTMTSDNDIYTITYTYDEKKNPYKGFLYELEDNGPAAWGSNNNVTSETYNYTEDGHTDSYTYNYTYEYDGKWPTQKTYTQTYSETILGTVVSSTYTNVTYFEYE